MATHSNIPARKIARTEKPGRLPSVGSQRVGRDWTQHRNKTEINDLFNKNIMSLLKIWVWTEGDEEASTWGLTRYRAQKVITVTFCYQGSLGREKPWACVCSQGVWISCLLQEPWAYAELAATESAVFSSPATEKIFTTTYRVLDGVGVCKWWGEQKTEWRRGWKSSKMQMTQNHRPKEVTNQESP